MNCQPGKFSITIVHELLRADKSKITSADDRGERNHLGKRHIFKQEICHLLLMSVILN